MLAFDAEASDFADFASTVSGTLRDAFGADKLDQLVYNAGIGTYAYFPDTTGEQIDHGGAAVGRHALDERRAGGSVGRPVALTNVSREIGE